MYASVSAALATSAMVNAPWAAGSAGFSSFGPVSSQRCNLRRPHSPPPRSTAQPTPVRCAASDLADTQ